MKWECLPKAVKHHLALLAQENHFDVTIAELNVSNLATGEIGSSCTVIVKEAERRLCVFVKFLVSRSESDFAMLAVEYFNNETVFYGEILEQFEQEVLTCVPKCYGVGRGTVPFIMMEHLAGYCPLNVVESLSVDLVRLILQQLGRLHAHSYASKDRCRHATSKLKETLFTVKYRKIFVHAIHDAFKLLKKSLPEDSAYVRKFADFLLGVFERLSFLSVDDEDYKVVTHGDLWPHNILWNSFNNSVKFIDFQGCRYSSPVHDLMLILLTGLDRSSRELHRADLIKTYHDSLCEKMEDLGVDPLRVFPMSALQEQIVKHTRFAMGVALVGLPLFYNEGQVSVMSSGGDDRLYEFFEEVRRRKSLRCKGKMLEIIMDCIDQGCL